MSKADVTEIYGEWMKLVELGQEGWLSAMPGGSPVDPASIPDLASSLSGTPGFDHMFGFDKKVAKLVDAAAELAAAAAELQSLTMSNWMDAYQQFATAGLSAPRTIKEALDGWFEFANESAIELQHTERFLKAQRRHVLALTEFRSAYRAIIEVYQTYTDQPSRTEVDDLSRVVHELKRELRALKREHRRSEAKPELVQERAA
jgi:hypothetical protein